MLAGNRDLRFGRPPGHPWRRGQGRLLDLRPPRFGAERLWVRWRRHHGRLWDRDAGVGWLGMAGFDYHKFIIVL